jgi:tetratricopeptide (TPR) repeat protein
MSGKVLKSNLFYNIANSKKFQKLLMKYLLLVALSLFILPASAQNKTKTEPAKETVGRTDDNNLEIYKKAMSFGDYEVAKNALFRLMVANPDSIKYLDSLVVLYFSVGAMPQCILAGNEYLKKDSANMNIMEMVALANSQLKKYKETVDLYEKMYMSSGNIYYAYQLAVNQYMLKRIGECNQMLDIIIKDPKSETEKIAITGDDNKPQQVPLKAAAMNLRGVILRDLNMEDKAKENFEAALKVMPEFALAKGNLANISQKGEEKKPEQKTAPQTKALEKKK